MGTKWSISNARRKLAAVVKEFAGERGLVLGEASHDFDGAATGHYHSFSLSCFKALRASFVSLLARKAASR